MSGRKPSLPSVPVASVLGGVLLADLGMGSVGPFLMLVFGLLLWTSGYGGLSRSMLVGLLFCCLGFGSALLRAPQGAVIGDAVCVGRISDKQLTGHCFGPRAVWVSLRLDLEFSCGDPPPGQYSISGVITPTGPARNPGERDPGKLSRLLGVHGRTSCIHPPALVGAKRPSLRRSVVERHVRLFGSDQAAAVIGAMSVGHRSVLEPGVSDAFRRAGLAHVLAISGFHLAVVGMGFFLLAGGLLNRLHLGASATTRLRASLTLIVVSAFAFLTGGAASTIRAALMTAILLARRFLGRSGADARAALLLAVTIYVVIRPGSVYGAGLLLSASAVYGILRDHGGRASSARVTYCALVFTTPVVAAYFGVVTPVGLATNVLAAPLAAVVVLGAVSAHLLQLSWLVAGTRFAAEALMGVAFFGSKAPALSVSASLVPALVAALLLGSLPRNPAGRRAITGCLMAGVLLLSNVRARRPLSVTYLDVGQGDAAIVLTPSGRSLLIDAGPQSAGFLVARALSSMGISKLDFAILSHDHSDHAGGLHRLRREFAIETEVSPVALAVPHKIAQAGTTVAVDGQTRVLVLAPEPWAAHTGNPSSLVLLLVHGSQSFLFLGDAERDSEYNLVRRWDTFLSASVVKVGHHGSRTSSQLPLVRRLSQTPDPKWAIISVGVGNRYGLPTPEVVQRWRDAGYRVLTTAQSGAVICSSSGTATECRPTTR